MDFDAVSHDAKTRRFLVRELKRPGERFDPAAWMALTALAREPRWTVWYLLLSQQDERIAWADMRLPESIDLLTEDEYRQRLADWWDRTYSLDAVIRRARREPGEEG